MIQKVRSEAFQLLTKDKSCFNSTKLLETVSKIFNYFMIKNFSYQVNQQLDKKNRLNHSLGNLISNDLPENEDHQENN